MYRIPVVKLSVLRNKIGKVCTATSGQPCEELHGREVTLNDGSKVLLCHAVGANGKDLVNSTQLSYPENLDTKADYLYVLDFFNEKDWESDFQTLLNNRLVWVSIGELENPKDRITDDLHKIKEINGVSYQYELKEDPNCKLFRIGFTVCEVETIIEDKIIKDEIWQPQKI